MAWSDISAADTSAMTSSRLSPSQIQRPNRRTGRPVTQPTRRLTVGDASPRFHGGVQDTEDMMDGPAITDLKSVVAPLNFLAPMAEKPVAFNYEPPPGTPVRTSQSVTYRVPIRDARPMIGRLSLDKEGV